MTEIINCIHGHTSPETAYVFEDWPFGFRLRCKRRVWLEFKEKKGFRFCSQTTNPKRAGEVWNKPHCSTYNDVGVMVWIKSAESPTGKEITWVGLSFYSDAEKVAKFEKDYAEAINADENVRKCMNGLKSTIRMRQARDKIERIFENAAKHLDGVFTRDAFVLLFEGDNALGNAIADKWEKQTEGVGVIKDWLRAALSEFMKAYSEGFEKAKTLKPDDSYKLLSPGMDTLQEGDLRLYKGEWLPAWTDEDDVQIVQSNGYYCRKKTP